MARESKAHKYSVINYFDVWGNEKDGWEVNNQCIEFDDLWLSDDITPKEICEYLKKIGLLATSDMRRIAVTDWGDLIEINEKKTNMPLFGLLMNN